MGGVAVQMVALTEPQLIRKLILAGTTSSTPGASSDVSGIVWPQEAVSRIRTHVKTKHTLRLFAASNRANHYSRSR
jgi:pimeloyl-ACP methyl ester carboxylesterase